MEKVGGRFLLSTCIYLSKMPFHNAEIIILLTYLHGIEVSCYDFEMSDFMAKMHLIRFRLGLGPRPRRGSLQRFPRLPSWIYGVLLLSGDGKGGEGKAREGGLAPMS